MGLWTCGAALHHFSPEIRVMIQVVAQDEAVKARATTSTAVLYRRRYCLFRSPHIDTFPLLARFSNPFAHGGTAIAITT